MDIAAGIVELVGAVASMTVAGIWARISFSRFPAASALLIAITFWALTNVWYASAFILQHGPGVIIWNTWHEQTAETVQQAATIAVPLATVFLIGQLARDKRRPR
jgi:hypothetical protein